MTTRIPVTLRLLPAAAFVPAAAGSAATQVPRSMVALEIRERAPQPRRLSASSRRPTHAGSVSWSASRCYSCSAVNCLCLAASRAIFVAAGYP